MGCFSTKKDLKIQEHQVGLLKGGQLNVGMIINKDQEDEMNICCYQLSKVKATLTYLFITITCGIAGLFFYWYPYVFLKWTSRKCPVDKATKILLTEIQQNGKYKSYHVKKLDVLTPESVTKSNQYKNLANHSIVLSENSLKFSVHFEKGIFHELDEITLFSCKKITYLWDSEKKEFVKLSGLDEGVPTDVLHQNNGLTEHERYMRQVVYGSNKILIKKTPLTTLLGKQVLDKLFIFQVCSFILWFYDNYLYYSFTILVMSLIGITVNVYQIRKNEGKLRATVASSASCTVLKKRNKNYESEVINSDQLVPGDLIEIPAQGCTLHCDAVLLEGTCILNESMLTGESVPVMKTPIMNDSRVMYNAKDHARHTLFCGTRVIQTRCFSDEKVYAVVTRTGFSTAKGNLTRSILYPPPVDFKFEKESYNFLLCLFCVALVGMIYTFVIKIQRETSVSDMIVEALDLITIVVPPVLPTAISIGRFYAAKELEKRLIYCISPKTIIVSGSVDCVCFDKTGTLTEDGLDLMGVASVNNLKLEKNIKELCSGEFILGLVCCHSLMIIDDEVVGDPLDLKMFESTNWLMEEDSDNNSINTIFKPASADEHKEIRSIRNFPFSSHSQRMGVVIKYINDTNEESVNPTDFDYYCKGSPEMILQLVNKDTIPKNFSHYLEEYTQRGFRVIAMAHKKLNMRIVKLHKITQNELETDLNFLGIIVFENQLKQQTTSCINDLNNARIRVVMITGDNILTALSVARECNIVTPQQSVITVNVDNETREVYYTLNSTKGKTSNNDLSIFSNSLNVTTLETIESQSHNNILKNLREHSYNNYRFAISGKEWEIIKEHHPELLPKLVTRGSVFARMSPDHKQQLVQELQNLEYVVAMCGDGANDCGALKAAHTGISLSEAEASVASPFTSKIADITCILNVIREGRAALVTATGIFKYIASYSLCQFISVLILYYIDSNLTDIEFMYIDLAMITVFSFLFGRTKSYQTKIVPEIPPNLMSLNNLLSLAIQVFLLLVFQVAVYEHLMLEDWYVPYNSDNQLNKDDTGCVENYSIFIMSSFQYIILVVTFSKGAPYRQWILSNILLMISIVVLTAATVYLTLWSDKAINDFFLLVVPEKMAFRGYLIGYAIANFVLSMGFEYVLFDKLIFKKLYHKFVKTSKNKKQFMVVENQLDRSIKWPPLSSDYKSAASPIGPPATREGEFIRESNKFDNNHILSIFNNDQRFNVENFTTPIMSSTSNNTPERMPYIKSQSQSSHFSYPNTPLKKSYQDYVNDVGLSSQEELPFSSIPSENLSSPSNFQSLSNTSLAASPNHVPDLPYDDYSTTFVNDMSQFNGLSTSPPNCHSKPLEMNNFCLNR